MTIPAHYSAITTHARLSTRDLPQALLNSSHKFYDAKHHFAHYGVVVDNPRVDWAAMQKQKDTAVSGLTKGIEGLLKKNKVQGCVNKGGEESAGPLKGRAT